MTEITVRFAVTQYFLTNTDLHSLVPSSYVKSREGMQKHIMWLETTRFLLSAQMQNRENVFA